MATAETTSGRGESTVMNAERRRITWQYAAMSKARAGQIIVHAPDLPELQWQVDELRIAPGEFYVKCLLPPGVVPAV
jgi:hypothetical protein